MEPIQPRKARMKPSSCSPALAMARSGSRTGSGAAVAQAGVCRCAPGLPGGGGAARRKLLRGALLPASPLEKLWVRVRVGAGVGRREAAATSGPGLRRRAAGRRDLKQPRPRPARPPRSAPWRFRGGLRGSERERGSSRWPTRPWPEGPAP